MGRYRAFGDLPKKPPTNVRPTAFFTMLHCTEVSTALWPSPLAERAPRGYLVPDTALIVHQFACLRKSGAKTPMPM
jgi:hypothetical protein